MVRRIRSDVVRNRERLIEAALGALGDRGLDVSIEEIAARAGLGVGTLYRHFPDKESLLQAAIVHQVEFTVRHVVEPAMEVPDPREAFCQLIRDFAAQVASDRVIFQMARLHPRDEPTEAFRQLQRGIGHVARRAWNAGVLRDALDATDVMAMVAMADRFPWADEERWPLYIEIILRGLLHDPPAATDEHAVTTVGRET